MSSLGTPEKQQQLFVEIRYGDPASPTYVRYTDWTFDTTFQSVSYLAKPELQVGEVEISGVLGDKELEIGLPIVTDSFEDKVSKGIERSRIFLSVWEQIYGSDGSPLQTLLLFKGRIVSARRNAMGGSNWIKLAARGIKQRLETPLGIPATHQCPWTLGGRGCGVAITPEAGTVSSIAGKAVVIAGLGAHVDRYWHRGYVTRGGRDILIRDWLSGTTFQLAEEPPPDWSGQAVTVTPGCDKTKETCEGVWNNLEFFGGVGYAIPLRHPSFEVEE